MGFPGIYPLLFISKSSNGTFMSPQLRKETIILDIAGLLHHAARKHEKVYRRGDFAASVAFVQATLVYLLFICKWNMLVLFDGMDSPLKVHERERRDSSDGLRNEALYIAMVAKVCKRMRIPFIVSKYDADTQCCVKHPSSGCQGSLIVTGDSDLLAYGHPRIMHVDSWETERHCIFDLTTPVLDNALQCNTLTADQTLMTTGYQLFGPRLFQVFAAVVGCDFSDQSAGMLGIGTRSFLKALQIYIAETARFFRPLHLSVPRFARLLIDCCRGKENGVLPVEEVIADIDCH